MQFVLPIMVWIVAYLIGSIPTAFLMGRLKGVDIRQYGSGNVGATNAFRVLGKGWGVACLLFDILKGWFPTFVLTRLLLLIGSTLPLPDWPDAGWLWSIGLCAILGHMFSPFLRFRGGKGVATSLGVLLAIALGPVLIALLVGMVIIWLTGYVSLASMVGSALLPPLILAFNWRMASGWGEAELNGSVWISILVTLLLAAVIIWKHRSNLARLRAGTEKRIFDKFLQTNPSERGDNQ